MNAHRRHLIWAAAALVIAGAGWWPASVFAQVVRGPYLQQTSSTSVRIKWRTAAATNSEVRYGLGADDLAQQVDAGVQATDHEVLVDGLQPDTRYYYQVRSSDSQWAGDLGHHFETAPVPGTPKSTQIWVLGDSGTANRSARAVRDSYLDWVQDEAPDVWLMLGDNAYPDGTDAQYQAAVFDMYPTVLRRVALWSTLGNHDGHSATSSDLQGPYYDIFSLPRKAEVGGVASGTEAYYSFDYANIHFVCLDSYDTPRTADGAMANWLRDDLSATSQHWVIAFWHHPPYTKGSHDSDTERRLIDMRENFLPILEDHGVDLVLSGHSHSYERSFLIDGHHGDSTTFSSAHLVDGGDGRADGDGAYRKDAGPHLGAVYAVPGSSGKLGGGLLDHPAMFVGLHELGSMHLRVHGNRLEATFLNSDGAVGDHFTLEKGPDSLAPDVLDVAAVSQTQVEVAFDEALDRSSATVVSNWDINGDIDVESATVSVDARKVTLKTDPLERNVLYELTISGVFDRHQNALPSPVVREFALADTTTMSFRDGHLPAEDYSGTTDTKLRSTEPTTNFGASEHLEADGSPAYAVLLRWDLSALPPASDVISAIVSMEVTNPSSDAYELFALRRDWREHEATWQSFRAGEPWQAGGAAGGADHDPRSLGSILGATEGVSTTALSPAGHALIERWVDDPSSNHGFLVAASDLASDGIDFSSRETVSVESRPMLTVQFHPELRRAPEDTVTETGDAGRPGDGPDADGPQKDTDAQSSGDSAGGGDPGATSPRVGEGTCACRLPSGGRAPGFPLWLGAVLLITAASTRRKHGARHHVFG